MKFSSNVKGIRVLFAVAIVSLCLSSVNSASALTLQPRNLLSGNLNFGNLIGFVFNDQNPLVGLFDGTNFSLVGDNVLDTAGNAWDLNFDYGTVVRSGNRYNVNHPANNDLGGLTALGDYTLNGSLNRRLRTGGTTGTNINTGTVLPVFSRGSFAATIDMLLNDNFNLATWLTLHKPGGGGVLAYGDPKLHGVPAQGGDPIPEPMSMSLLAIGLLGGGIARKKRLAA